MEEMIQKTSIPRRRIPGTLALGTTNLIASLYIFRFTGTAPDVIGRYMSKYVPLDIWGVLVLFSGILLIMSTLYRRWDIFNVGAALSLFFWAVVVGSIFASWITGNREALSSIALGMAWWMMFGQMAMLFAPLFNKWEDPL